MYEQKREAFRLTEFEAAGLALIVRRHAESKSHYLRACIARDLANDVAQILDDPAWPVGRVDDFIVAAIARAESNQEWAAWGKHFSAVLNKLAEGRGYGPEARRALQKAFRMAPNQAGGGGWTGADVDDGTVTEEEIE